ncbi:hypothetical protein AB0H57_01360 [Micromonospora sp. NPDC050686]|uniref:hypothetical protein n=1 Tax=Micromonospora sp. NPDC050686 TaxID=3154631 RepID=UPI0033D77EB1
MWRTSPRSPTSDGRTPRLTPVYDFHSLSFYSSYRWSPLALSLASETVPSAITADHFRRLAERAGADPDGTAEVVAEAVDRLREAWTATSADTRGCFEALAEHYTRRLDTLAICRSID